MPEITRKHKLPSTVWRKGISANPGGRPAIAKEVREAAREHSTRAIARLRELMESKNESVAIRAAEALLDRAIGRPALSVEVGRSEEVLLHGTVTLDADGQVIWEDPPVG